MIYTIEVKQGIKYPYRVRFTAPSGLSIVLASFPTEESAKAWIAHTESKKTIYQGTPYENP
jgi:hypothetical protein